MPRKPSNLIYGLDDKPPLLTTILLGLQHVSVFFIAIIFPVLIIRKLGVNIDPRTASGFISFSMIAGGVTTILQALKKTPIGSGYLCPSVCGPSYLSASFIAVQSGGLPLLFGMTGFVGIVESLFSRIMHKLRSLFPAEVTGTIVAMVGITIIPVAMNNFLGLSASDVVSTKPEIIVGIGTLSMMALLNVFSKGKLRLYSALIGMIFGYILSFYLGIIPVSSFRKITEAHIFAIPHIKNMSWAFDIHLVIPFVIATLCSALKTVGDLTTCQKINDADWKRPEMKSISGGILADGIGGIIPGIIGGFGQSTSSTHVGLSLATGATSRKIAFSMGIFLIALGFLPKLANIFLIMPKPVMGATLIFAVSFMIVAGFQIIISRMMDSRKILVVGISIIMGLSVDMIPGAYANVHPWIKSIFSSSLSFAAIVAVVLNLIFRIGIVKHKTIAMKPGIDSSQKIFDFMERQGNLWGARKEIIYNAISVMNEFMESISITETATSDIEMDVSFDEFNLNINIDYEGKLFEFPDQKPSKDALRTSDKALQQLSGFMIRQYVDKISSEHKNGHSHILFHFEH
ncbi:MAG: purine/pyrimidine permease [Candidatus Cloacimonetes bacterium]|nr:purine/pyrimidine permease [Candidatus Cloacimonadota bacterium]